MKGLAVPAALLALAEAAARIFGVGSDSLAAPSTATFRRCETLGEQSRKRDGRRGRRDDENGS